MVDCSQPEGSVHHDDNDGDDDDGSMVKVNSGGDHDSVDRHDNIDNDCDDHDDKTFFFIRTKFFRLKLGVLKF